MRGLMRMLMMFGPMLYRQYQKYQQNKARQQSAQNLGTRQIENNNRIDRQTTLTIKILSRIGKPFKN